MGENFLEEQVKNFEKRRRIAHIDVNRPSFFTRPEINSIVYTVCIEPGAVVERGEPYLASVSATGEGIDVVAGNCIVGRIEGDGAKSLSKGMNEPGHPGVVSILVTEVSQLSGFGKAVVTGSM